MNEFGKSRLRPAKQLFMMEKARSRIVGGSIGHLPFEPIIRLGQHGAVKRPFFEGPVDTARSRLRSFAGDLPSQQNRASFWHFIRPDAKL